MGIEMAMKVGSRKTIAYGAKFALITMFLLSYNHNPYVFTNWLAGGGIKGGVSHGPSDEWGYKPLDRDNPTRVYDIHATMLHLLGIDHKRFTVRHNGIDRRLTDVHGHLIEPIVA